MYQFKFIIVLVGVGSDESNINYLEELEYQKKENLSVGALRCIDKEEREQESSKHEQWIIIESNHSFEIKSVEQNRLFQEGSKIFESLSSCSDNNQRYKGQA